MIEDEIKTKIESSNEGVADVFNCFHYWKLQTDILEIMNFN